MKFPEALGHPIVCDLTLPQGPAGSLEAPDFDAIMQERAELGITFTSVTIASDELSVGDTVRWIAAARQYFSSQPEKFILVERAADIHAAHAQGKLAINLHFQGSNPLGGDFRLVEIYKRMGIGHMLLAYNYQNLTGSGCHEPVDSGLTVFGREVIREMNRVRMVVDISHTGARTALEAIEASERPVIASHSNSRVVFDHERNIPDEVAKAVAASGGVIGISGVGLFLSAARSDVSAKAIARHVNHFAGLVGPRHVGIGLDSVSDVQYFTDHFGRKNRHRYRTGGYFKQTPCFAGPAVIPALAEELLATSWKPDEVKGVLGENWLRVLEQVWDTP
jgi:membrane dipeptidase